jgi:hypothetical protein
VVRPAGALGDTVPAKVAALLPPERREMCRVIQIRPMGDFLTYGIGVPLLKMRHPELSRARVAVEGSPPARSRR